MAVVIPIAGEARHGKDTLASFLKAELEERGKRVFILRYADYLKFIAKEYFGWNGNKDEAGRSLLQTLGTDVIRSRNEFFWIDAVLNVIGIFHIDYDYFLIPDARFPNEITELHDISWETISVKVVREHFENDLNQIQRQHSSETSLEDFEFDFVISHKTLEELESHAQMFVDYLVVNYE